MRALKMHRRPDSTKSGQSHEGSSPAITSKAKTGENLESDLYLYPLDEVVAPW